MDEELEEMAKRRRATPILGSRQRARVGQERNDCQG